MNQPGPRLLLGVVLAVVVPAVVLDLTVGEDRSAAKLSAAPFAWHDVLLAHLAAALPLGLVVAAWVRSLPGVSSSARWPWGVLGLVAAGIGAAVSSALDDVVARSEYGAFPLLLLRSLLAFVLVLPWCIAALDPPAGIRRLGPPGIAFAVGLGLAVIPCGLYAEAVTLARTQETAVLLTQRRLVKAQRLVTGLCELGSKRPVGNMPPAEVRERLAGALQALRWEVGGPYPPSAMPAARLYRAVMLVQLERLDEAAAFLRPLVPGDNTATLMLAAVHQNQQQWDESNTLYAGVLEKLLPLSRTEETARTACRTAFDGLADNARLSHRPADAEAVLNRGLKELPADAAHYHFLLGRHYHDAGRFGLALEHLRTAARHDLGDLREAADDLIRKIRTSTPGCLLAGSH